MATGEIFNELGKRLSKNQRGIICAVLGEVFGVVYHAAALVFFYLQGITPLFYFNIFSVICFSFGFYVLFVLKNMDIAFYLNFFEVLVHQVLADYFLGSLAGFHFLIMIMVIYPFLVERRNFNVGIPLSFVSLAIFFLCELVFSRTSPVYVLDENLLRMVRFVNIAMSMSVIFTMIVIFKLIIGYIENSMEELNEKNEALLENILPKKVVENLREKGKSDPESFDEVSVFFSDIVNFTSISKTLTPTELIGELNDIFTNFDKIMDSHECVRIKTIGDAYMAVCGLPEKNPNHLENIVSAALECRDYLQKRNESSSHKWVIRLGVHTGEVVAGIVGIKKYIYDIFGDTVNVASRMETSSEEMKLCVSEDVYEKAKDRFAFSFRGEKEIKGKGKMNLYFAEW